MSPRAGRVLPSLIAALAWGAMFPVAASALRRVDAFHLTALRYGLATLAFVALLAAKEGVAALRPQGRFLELMALGTAGFAAFNLLANLGLEHTRTQDAALIVALTPLLTALADWRLTGRRPARATVLGLVFALAGVALVITRGNPAAALHGGLGGDALVLAGAIGFMAFTLGARRFPGFSPLRYTALSAVGGTITILAVTEALTLAGVEHAPSGADVTAVWPQIAYMIAIAAVIAVLAWNEGVRRLGAPNAALFMNLVPVVTFAVAVVRGYRPVAAELVGAAITVAALAGANVAGRQAIRRPSRLAWAATRSAKLAKSRA